MNSAIEAMARVLALQACPPVYHWPYAEPNDAMWPAWVGPARAALTALAENITPEMVRAGCEAIENAEGMDYGEDNPPPFPFAFWQNEARDCLRAMCAAAVKGEG